MSEAVERYTWGSEFQYLNNLVEIICKLLGFCDVLNSDKLVGSTTDVVKFW